MYLRIKKANKFYVFTIVSVIFLFLIMSFASSVSAQSYTCEWDVLIPSRCTLQSENCPANCHQPTDSDCLGYMSEASCAKAFPCDCALPPPSPGGSGINWTGLYTSIQQGPGAIGFLARRPGLGFIITALLTYIFPSAGLLLLLFLVWGGFQFLTSAGDPKRAAAAKGTITTAVLGFIIVFAAYWIVRITGIVLGMPSFGGIFQ